MVIVGDGRARLPLECGLAVATVVNVDTESACCAWCHDKDTSAMQEAKLSLSTQLTFASLNALDPCMTKLCVTDITTVLEPSPSASTTTEPAGLFGSAALGACNIVNSWPPHSDRRIFVA